MNPAVTQPERAEASGPRTPRRTVTRVGLAAAMTLVGLNLWTGAPLLAVWVGSKASSQTGATTGTVVIVIAVLGVGEFVLYQALRWLDARFGEVIGRKAGTRQPHPWLKSISGERVPRKRPREPLTPTERIVVLVVVAAITAFEFWFFFLAGSSLPR